MPAKPELEYYLVAESHSVDQTSNRVSVFNVLEAVTSGKEFAGIPQMTAISVWNVPEECTDVDFLAEVRLLSPDGRDTATAKIGFTGRAKRQRLFHNMFGVKFDAEGRWRLELLLDGQHVANHSIDIMLNNPELVQKLRQIPKSDANDVPSK